VKKSANNTTDDIIKTESEEMKAEEPEEIVNIKEIAAKLQNVYDVDPESLGDYLSKHGNNEELLEAFVGYLNFSNVSIVDGLRLVFRNLQLGDNNEAMLHKLLLAFSTAYNRDNMGSFTVADTPYHVAVTLMRLNSSLEVVEVEDEDSIHPLTIRNKSEFETMIREFCPKEENISKKLVTQWYESIESKPIEINNTDSVHRFMIKAGWCKKKNNQNKTLARWQKRYVLLSGVKGKGYGLYLYGNYKDVEYRSKLTLSADMKCVVTTQDDSNVILKMESKDGVPLAYANKANNKKGSKKGSSIGPSKRDTFSLKFATYDEACGWKETIETCLANL